MSCLFVACLFVCALGPVECGSKPMGSHFRVGEFPAHRLFWWGLNRMFPESPGPCAKGPPARGNRPVFGGPGPVVPHRGRPAREAASTPAKEAALKLGELGHLDPFFLFPSPEGSIWQGCGLKLKSQGYACFSLWFHLPGPFWYIFLSRSHVPQLTFRQGSTSH